MRGMKSRSLKQRAPTGNTGLLLSLSYTMLEHAELVVGEYIMQLPSSLSTVARPHIHAKCSSHATARFQRSLKYLSMKCDYDVTRLHVIISVGSAMSIAHVHSQRFTFVLFEGHVMV